MVMMYLLIFPSLHRHGIQFRALLFMGRMGRWLLYIGFLGHRGAGVHRPQACALDGNGGVGYIHASDGSALIPF